MMSVPNIPPAELRTLVTPFAVSIAAAGSCHAHAFPTKSIFTSHHTMVLVVTLPVHVPSTFRVILFESDPIKRARVHHVFIVLELHSVFLSRFGSLTALMSMSQNERVSPTIAGTKQSPTNSLMVNVSLSPHIIADPATNWKVNSGENIAYTQSLIALTRSIATRARVRSPNTRNISIHTRP